MTRRHRAWHRLIWPVLAALAVTGLVLALALRPEPAAGGAGATLQEAVR